MGKYFLAEGNGHQIANRRLAMKVAQKVLGVVPIDESTVRFEPYGTCHFAAYTHPKGAMISTPGRDDNDYGSADWHHRDATMMFRDFGDGRGIIYVSRIRPLFDLRKIGFHGVRWEDVLKTSTFQKVFRFSDVIPL